MNAPSFPQVQNYFGIWGHNSAPHTNQEFIYSIHIYICTICIYLCIHTHDISIYDNIWYYNNIIWYNYKCTEKYLDWLYDYRYGVTVCTCVDFPKVGAWGPRQVAHLSAHGIDSLYYYTPPGWKKHGDSAPEVIPPPNGVCLKVGSPKWHFNRYTDE